MKATGIIRKVDDLGRIVIPKEIRNVQGINSDDPLEIYVENDGIFLKKYNGDACVFCGETSIHTFQGKNICQGCLKSITKNEGVVKHADK